MSKPKPRYNKPAFVAQRLKIDAPPPSYEQLRDYLRRTISLDAANFLVGIAIDTAEALRQERLRLTKEDARAEINDLLGSIRETVSKLRSLSPELDRMLGQDADPLGAADKLDALIVRIEGAKEGVETRRWPRLNEVEHNIALNMAIKVILAADCFDKRLTIGKAELPGTAEPVLQAVGNAAGINREEATWRDTYNEASKYMEDNSPPK